MQLFEQLQGDGRGFDQLAFGQLEGQAYTAWGKVLEEGSAVIQQAQVTAVVGGDIDADMETVLQ
ncbi:hypothetical protein D3C81_384120 [compost metagenome]